MGASPRRWPTASSRHPTDCSPRWRRIAASCNFRGAFRCWPSMAKVRTTPASRCCRWRCWRVWLAGKRRGYPRILAGGGAAGGDSADQLGGGLRAGDLLPAAAAGRVGRARISGLARAGRRGAGLAAGLLLAHPELRQDHRLQLAGRFLRLSTSATSRCCALAGMAAGVLLIRAAVSAGCAGPSISAWSPWAPSSSAGSRPAFYVYGVDTIPESRRYAIEFELFLALALVEALRLAMQQRQRDGAAVRHRQRRRPAAGRAAAALGLCHAGLAALAARRAAKARSSISWPAGSREHPPAGPRLRLRRTALPPQLLVRSPAGGRRLRNRTAAIACRWTWPTASAPPAICGPDTRPKTRSLELKALGAEYVVVHGPKSQEYYRDFVRPERMAPACPPSSTSKTTPSMRCRRGRWRTSCAPKRFPNADVREHPEVLTRYVAAIEDPSRPALRAGWTGHEHACRSTGPCGRATWWPCRSMPTPAGAPRRTAAPIAITEDKLGFVVLHPAPAAATRIELHYWGTAGTAHHGRRLRACAWIARRLFCALPRRGAPDAPRIRQDARLRGPAVRAQRRASRSGCSAPPTPTRWARSKRPSSAWRATSRGTGTTWAGSRSGTAAFRTPTATRRCCTGSSRW